MLLGRRLQFVLSRALHAGAAARRGLRLSPPLPEATAALYTCEDACLWLTALNKTGR